jgi:hypothetical protein
LRPFYNTLHQFTEAGLLRQVAIDSSKSYFDTNNTEHHHYCLEDRHELMDIPPTDVAVGKVALPPAGYEVVRIDVVACGARHRRRSYARCATGALTRFREAVPGEWQFLDPLPVPALLLNLSRWSE